MLKSSAQTFSEYGGWFDNIEPRIVDLMQPFRSFSYYHPDQFGSTSLKALLPVLTGKSYEGLDISDGGMASREFVRIASGGASRDENARVRAQLEEYCALDTMAMVDIVAKLKTVSDAT